MTHNVSTESINGNNVLVINLTGELDHHSAEDLRDCLDDEIRASGLVDCIIDMTQVGFMDSSGLGVLLGRYKLITSRGGRLTVRNPNKTIDRILRMSGIYSIADVTKKGERK